MRGKAPRPGQSTIRNSGSRKHVAPPPQQRRAPASLKVTKPPGGADHVVVGTDKPALCATSHTQSKTAADPQARMQMKKQRAAGGSANLAKRSELSATPRKLHPSTPASHALAALRTTDAPTPARSALASDLAAALTMPPSNAPPAGQRVITLDLGARKLRYGDVGGRASFKIGAPGPGASKPRRLARPGPDFDRKERPQRPTRKQYDTRKMTPLLTWQSLTRQNHSRHHTLRTLTHRSLLQAAGAHPFAASLWRSLCLTSLQISRHAAPGRARTC
jgi:hypothetical protein